MTSMRLQVPAAIVTLFAAALPTATVVGSDEDAPAAVPVGGRAVVRTGDRGTPELDLGPIAYNWDHRIPVELSAPDEATLDSMLVAIDVAVAADRTLGGLVEWLDFESPSTGPLTVEKGARRPHGTELTLIASYATATALG